MIWPKVRAVKVLRWHRIHIHGMFVLKKFYSLKQMAGKILAGQWLSVGVVHYARKLNRMWVKRNRTFLRVVDLLKPQPGARISVDYREDVSLEF